MSAVGNTSTCYNCCSLEDAGNSSTSAKLSKFTLVLLLPVKSTAWEWIASVLPRRSLWAACSCVIFGPHRIFPGFTWLSTSLYHLQNFLCAIVKRKLLRAIDTLWDILWSVLVVLRRLLKPPHFRRYLGFSPALFRSPLLSSWAFLLAKLNGGRTFQALFDGYILTRAACD